MLGFKPRISGVVSNCSTNWVTTTTQSHSLVKTLACTWDWPWAWNFTLMSFYFIWYEYKFKLEPLSRGLFHYIYSVITKSYACDKSDSRTMSRVLKLDYFSWRQFYFCFLLFCFSMQVLIGHSTFFFSFYFIFYTTMDQCASLNWQKQPVDGAM